MGRGSLEEMLEVSYVFVEDGTPGDQVCGVFSVLWCVSAAEALWLVSLLYHNHLLTRQEIGMLL